MNSFVYVVYENEIVYTICADEGMAKMLVSNDSQCRRYEERYLCTTVVEKN